MKIFYGGTFINKEQLKEEKIYTPIKLEYYKIKNGEKWIENYGIEILKTKYEGEEILTEKAEINNITSDENTIENLLEILKRNEVTPISANEIIQDLLYQKSSGKM